MYKRERQDGPDNSALLQMYAVIFLKKILKYNIISLSHKLCSFLY